MYTWLCQNRIIQLQQLSGTFLMAYTSAPKTSCHRVTYVTDTNGAITARIESPGCCVQSSNYNFASTQVAYDIGPIPGYFASCPSLINETGSMKLLDTTGSGKSLCLIVAVCQSDYYGINVACKGSTPILLTIQIVLFNLLGSLGLTLGLNLQSVPQTDCLFPSNNCPAWSLFE